MAKDGSLQEVNEVHQNAILTETIKKEHNTQKLFTEFSINPTRKLPVVTGKPNSLYDSTVDTAQKDELMVNQIAYTSLPPTKKYKYPQTESQEYGWITQPLIDTDRNDVRLWHARATTDITKPKEKEWALNEQTKNLT